MTTLTRVIIAAAVVLLVGGGVASAGGTITYIDAPGAYLTTCYGGVVGVVTGGENDIIAECAIGDAEQVLCGLPGAVDWLPADDQIVVTCEEPK